MGKVLTVLGNNSGRNAGDMAILGNLLHDISLEMPDVRFMVPTTNPAFLNRHFGHYNMKPIPLLPWYGALKNFGLPLWWGMLKGDAVLVTDNILFDRQFYNPVFNNLASISLAAPLCRKKGIPIVLYNASVGPIDFPIGEKALRRVMDACPLAITRDEHTANLLRDLNLKRTDILVHADCALNTVIPPTSRLEEIIQKEKLFQNPKGTLGFNVNAYIDNWSPGGTLTNQNFGKVIANAIDKLIEALDVDVMFAVTQVMDLKVTRACVRFIRHQDRVRIISNVDYTYEEIAGLLDRVEVHTGLRTHTLIFAAAMHTPMVCIKSYPKSTGFMQTIDQGQWTIGFEDLTPEGLSKLVLRAWEKRAETRQNLIPIVENEKLKARRSAKIVSNLFEG